MRKFFNKSLSFLTILLSIFILSTVYADENQSPESLGHFIFAKGDVLLKHVNTEDWISVKSGDTFLSQDEIKTGEDGKAEMLFKNGNIIWISSLSKMIIEDVQTDKLQNKEKTKLKLFWGRMTNTIEKMFSDQSSFEVETNVAIAAVKGTKFYMDFNEDDGEASVGVYDGVVEVDNRKGQKTRVEKGKAMDVGSEGKMNEKELTETDMAAIKEQESDRSLRINDTFFQMAQAIHSILQDAQQNIANYRDETVFNQLRASTIDLLQTQVDLLADQLNEENKVFFQSIVELFQAIESAHKSDVQRATIPPVKPEGLELALTEKGEVTLVWLASDSEDVVKYVIYRNGDIFAESKTVEFFDLKVKIDEEYAYQIQAVDQDNNPSELSEEVSIVVSAESALQQPEDISASLDSDTGKVQVEWAKSRSFATAGYNIYRNGDHIGNATSTRFADDLLVAVNRGDLSVRLGDTLIYTVRSISIMQEEGEPSDEAEVELPDELPEIGAVYINGIHTEEIEEKVTFMQDDLFANQIEISGSVIRPGFGIQQVLVSIDGDWKMASGKEDWVFNFPPQPETDIEIFVKVVDIIGNEVVQDSADGATLYYIPKTRRNLAEETLQLFKEAYNLEDITGMMNLISLDFEPDSFSLQENIERTWELYDSAQLFTEVISVNSNDNELELSFGWTRQYNLEGYRGSAKGTADLILVWNETAWLIKSIERESPFYIDEAMPPGSFELTKPSTNLITDWHTGLQKARVNLEWTEPQDRGLGIKKYEIYVDYKLNSTQFSSDLSRTIYLGNGDYVIFVRVYDYLGNSKRSKTRSITVNGYPPDPPFRN